jgi:hypothetical protein
LSLLDDEVTRHLPSLGPVNQLVSLLYGFLMPSDKSVPFELENSFLDSYEEHYSKEEDYVC